MCGERFKNRFSHRGRLLMLVKACLCTVKVCKCSFHHFRSLLNNVMACLSAGKDSKRRFSHRGRLLMLVKACLNTVKVCKHRFAHRRSSCKPVEVP